MSNEVPGGSHTPGPWAWEAHDPSMTTLGTSDGNGGVDFANEVLSVSRCKSCQKDPGRLLCHMPNEADAHLIAAAPTMLAALQGALRIASLWIPSDDTPEEHWEEAKALYLMRNSFEEAIAAAHGAKA
jgi:hypothetical protein